MTYIKKKRPPYDQRTADLTPEEKEMRKENLAARARMNNDAIRKLCASVCLSAVCDYTKIRKKLADCKRAWAGKEERQIPEKTRKRIEDYEKELEEIREFFGSEMFVHYSGILDPEETIRHIDEMPRSYMIILERGAY